MQDEKGKRVEPVRKGSKGSKTAGTGPADLQVPAPAITEIKQTAIQAPGRESAWPAGTPEPSNPAWLRRFILAVVR